MAIHDLTGFKSKNIKTIEVKDILNRVSYGVLKSFSFMIKGKTYRFKKGDIIFTPDSNYLGGFGDNIARINDPEDIIPTFLYMGAEGHVSIPLNVSKNIKTFLSFDGETKSFKWEDLGLFGKKITVRQGGRTISRDIDTIDFGPSVKIVTKNNHAQITVPRHNIFSDKAGNSIKYFKEIRRLSKEELDSRVLKLSFEVYNPESIFAFVRGGSQAENDYDFFMQDDNQTVDFSNSIWGSLLDNSDTVSFYYLVELN